MGWNCPSCGYLLRSIDGLGLSIRRHLCDRCGDEWEVHSSSFDDYIGAILVYVAGNKESKKHDI